MLQPNLIQMQQKLSLLPPTPESLQYLTAASQGMNTAVPPYLALMRMNEIKRDMEMGGPQAAPPTEPMNESLPKQLSQQMGLAALQKGRAGQAQEQMMKQGMAAPQPVPPGVPQPESQEPEMAAGGGLMGLPVDSRMFDYGGGGIVSFKGGSEDAVEEKGVGLKDLRAALMKRLGITEYEPPEKDPARAQVAAQAAAAASPEVPVIATPATALAASTAVSPAAPPVAPPVAPAPALKPMSGATDAASLALYNQMLEQYGKLAAVEPPKQRSLEAIRQERMLGEDYGIAAGPQGAEYLTGLEKARVAREAESTKQRGEEKSRTLRDLSQALIAGGQATRGQKGIGSLFGGIGTSLNKSAEAAAMREQGLREQTLKQNELMNEAQYKVQELRRAQLSGDVAAVQKADAEFAKIAENLNVSKATLLGHFATGITGLMGREAAAAAAEYNADRRFDDARARAVEAANKQTSPDKQIAGIAAKLKEDNPGWSEATITSEAIKQYLRMKAAGMPGVEAKIESTKDTEAKKRATARLTTDAAYLQAVRKGDAAAQAARRAVIFAEEGVPVTPINIAAPAPDAGNAPPPPPGYNRVPQ